MLVGITVAYIRNANWSHCQGPHRVDASRFWAVLIGIDEYASYPLRGCVPDIQLMEKYFTEDLSVPRNRIQLLVGSNEHLSPRDSMNPSRAHILAALLSLVTNPEIAYGDNIIIYFSGHGSSYPPGTKGDSEADYIQALCPIDRDTPGENGKPVPDISDREFNTILSLISRVKGHNITVILDCCYSGGVSRDVPELGARTSPPMMRATVQDMLITGENNLMRYPGYRSILATDWLPDMDSHIALAACRDYQYAKEKEVRREDGKVAGHIGIFTDSLVRALQSGHWRKETTYVDLVHCLDKTPFQTPGVSGDRKCARLWYQE